MVVRRSVIAFILVNRYILSLITSLKYEFSSIYFVVADHLMETQLFLEKPPCFSGSQLYCPQCRTGRE